MRPSARFKNITFDDTNPLFTYSVNGTADWATNLPDPSLFSNRTLHWLFTNGTNDVGQITFRFPKAARTMYYYRQRPSPSFSICIDDCSLNQTTIHEDLSESGGSLIHVIRFETPGIHQIVLSGSVKEFTTTKEGCEIAREANFSLDKIDLEVLDNPATSSISSTPSPTPGLPSSAATTLAQTQTLASRSTSSNVGKIVGGVIGGIAGAVLCILTIWLWFHRRCQKQEQIKLERLQPFSSIPPASQQMCASEMATTVPLAAPRFTTIISNGKQIVCPIEPQIRQAQSCRGTATATAESCRGTAPAPAQSCRGTATTLVESAVDGGPVNDSACSDVEQMMPPQYEQVFGGSAENQDVEQSRGTHGREARRKPRR